jgi:hypothetical protein
MIHALFFVGFLAFGAWLIADRATLSARDGIQPILAELKARGLWIDNEGQKVTQRIGNDAWSVGLDPMDYNAYDDRVTTPERAAK